MNRQALIVTGAVLAPLFWAIGIANFVIDQPAGVIGGISALIVGTCIATTTCLFIASGGQPEKRERRPRREAPVTSPTNGAHGRRER